MLGGRLERELYLVGDIADARLARLLEKAQDREPSTIRKRFHDPLEIFFRYFSFCHIPLFYHSRELEKIGWKKTRASQTCPRFL